MRHAARVIAALLAVGGAAAQDLPGDAAAGRMLYRDTPLLRGALQACAQCHPNPLNQRRGLTLEDQQDHIRCAIQGGCGGATLAVYPYGNMAQFQGLLSGVDLQHLARYIREPAVSAAWPRLQPRSLEAPSAALSLTLDNAGELPLRVQGWRFEGRGAADFQVAAQDCNAPLAPAARCTLQLAHAPRCGLRREAALFVDHDGPLSPARVRLVSAGQGAAPPEAQAEPAALGFAVAAVDQSLSLRVVNACGGELPLTALRIEGPFERADSGCDAARLTSGQSCELRLRRRLAEGAPEAVRAGSGALWIDSPGTAPLRVPLSAAALAAARPRWEPASALPTPRAGESLLVEAGRLHNAGDQPLLVQGLRSSTPGFELEGSESCRDGLLLAAGARCPLRLRVNGLAAGSASTQITLRAAPGAVTLTAELRLQVSAAPTAPATGGGGGGSASPLFLLLLALAAFLSKPNRRPASW